jgi:hypothetical protein
MITPSNCVRIMIKPSNCIQAAPTMLSAFQLHHALKASAAIYQNKQNQLVQSTHNIPPVAVTTVHSTQLGAKLLLTISSNPARAAAKHCRLNGHTAALARELTTFPNKHAVSSASVGNWHLLPHRTTQLWHIATQPPSSPPNKMITT